MTVPVLRREKFINFLKEHGFIILETKYWDQFDRIIFEKDGHTFPLPVKEKYFYPAVCKICEDFGIEPPADHKKVYDQHMAYLRSKKD